MSGGDLVSGPGAKRSESLGYRGGLWLHDRMELIGPMRLM